MQKRLTSMLIPYCFKDNNLYIFLQRRSADAPRKPNSLGAFGGGLENKENYEEALIREMNEELEYKPVNYSLLGVFEDDYSISNYYIEKVDENFEKNITIHEGKGGEWHKATEVIKRDDVGLNTKNVIIMIINKIQKYRKFYITGVSGTGKTTIAEELNKRGIHAIDIDYYENKLCSWKNKETKEKAHFEYGIGLDFLKANGWYCDVERLKELININEDVYVVGMTENQDDYLDLFDKVFILQCSERIFFKRIDDRTTNGFGKDPSEKEHILSFYKNYETDMIKKGAIPINAEESIDNVVNAIISNS